MGILSSVLPGLRDVRAPLAAGIAWLLGLYLLLQDSDWAQRAVSSLRTSVQPLLGPVGGAGTTAALLSCAYVLGAVLAVHAADVRRAHAARAVFMLTRRIIEVGRRLVSDRDGGSWFSDDKGSAPTGFREALVVYRFREPELARLQRELPEGRKLREVLAIFDGPAAAIRLHLHSRELWDQYDRLLGEAEFRLSLALPAPCIGAGVAHASGVSPVGWVVALVIGVIGSLALTSSADYKAQQANGVLLQAIRTGAIEDEALGVLGTDSTQRSVTTESGRETSG